MRLALSTISAFTRIAPRFRSKPAQKLPQVTRATPRTFSTITMSADESEIRSQIKHLATYPSPDGTMPEWPEGCLIIRNSGNPITPAMIKQMMASEGITSSGELIEIKTLDVGTDMAYATTMQGAKFTYKGTPNDDVFVFTYVFKKLAGKWICVHGFRSEGRLPSADPPGPWP